MRVRTPPDLSSIPLVDNHCHAVYRDQHFADAGGWRAAFTESSDPETPRRHVQTTLFFQRLIAHLADVFDCEPSEEAVFRARSSREAASLIQTLFGGANVDTLVVDTGFPPPDLAMPDAAFGRLAGCRIARILRLEVLMQQLVASHDTLPDVEAALQDELADVRARGFVGLKSIAAYRTGLNVRRWERTEAERAFEQARAEVREHGTVRIAHKALLDTLLHLAFEQAARQELPIQFHTGYGDTDADMILANPLYLRDVLEETAYRGMRVVLLHESYPYTRQAGYLTAVYDNVYLDLSFAIPFLSYGAMLAFTREAVGVAPLSKLLYASDAVGVPELFWMSAIDGRGAIAHVLAEAVRDGDLPSAQLEQTAARILHDNSERLYGLTPPSSARGQEKRAGRMRVPKES